MAVEGADLLAGGEFPHAHAAVVPGRDGVLAVRERRDRPDVPVELVPDELADFLRLVVGPGAGEGEECGGEEREGPEHEVSPVRSDRRHPNTLPGPVTSRGTGVAPGKRERNVGVGPGRGPGPDHPRTEASS